MCSAPDIKAPPPPPAPPPVLEQLAPKSVGDKGPERRRDGLSRYKTKPDTGASKTINLGGIPTKTGVAI